MAEEIARRDVESSVAGVDELSATRSRLVVPFFDGDGDIETGPSFALNLDHDVMRIDGAITLFEPLAWAAGVRSHRLRTTCCARHTVPDWDGRPNEIYRDGYVCVRCWFQWGKLREPWRESPLSGDGFVVCAMCEPSLIKKSRRTRPTWYIWILECHGDGTFHSDCRVMEVVPFEAGCFDLTHLARLARVSIEMLVDEGWSGTSMCLSFRPGYGRFVREGNRQAHEKSILESSGRLRERYRELYE